MVKVQIEIFQYGSRECKYPIGSIDVINHSGLDNKGLCTYTIRLLGVNGTVEHNLRVRFPPNAGIFSLLKAALARVDDQHLADLCPGVDLNTINGLPVVTPAQALDLRLELLCLPEKKLKRLQQRGYYTLADLVWREAYDVWRIPSIGKGTVMRLVKVMAKYGLSFGMIQTRDELSKLRLRLEVEAAESEGDAVDLPVDH